MPTDKIDYIHGDQGSKPPDGDDATQGEAADPQKYDWFISTFVRKINGIVGDISDILDGSLTVQKANNVTGTYKSNDIDSNGDGVVDTADYANDADASTYKNNDIDSDGDGAVDEADVAGGSTGVFELDGDIVGRGGDLIWDESQDWVTLTALEASTFTVNGGNAASGGSASLGGSVTVDVNEGQIDHGNISGVSSSQHHTRYSDSEARTAVDGANVDITGDADSVDGSDVYVQSTTPSSPTAGDIWIDTS